MAFRFFFLFFFFLTLVLISEHFYSDENINICIYASAIEFIFAIICMQIT